MMSDMTISVVIKRMNEGPMPRWVDATWPRGRPLDSSCMNEPTPKEQRAKQHRELTAEIDKRMLQNADNFDKAILTYSSAGLALSLAFLKDFVPIAGAKHPALLYSSWLLFVAAIVVTVGSYVTSQFAQRRELERSHRYNMLMDDSAFDLPNWPARLTTWAGYLAGLCFVCAVGASTLFVALNLREGSSEMATNNPTRVNNGATVPTMQRVPQTIERGAPVPTMHSIPQSQPGDSQPAAAPAAAPAPASGQASGTDAQ